MNTSEKIAIVGAGHAAGQLVASLKQHNYPGRLLLIGDEPWLPYQRPPLSKKFLSGELETERLYVKPPAFYEDDRLELMLDTRIEHIDIDNRQLTTDRGGRLDYEKLVLALGSLPRRIDVPGASLKGVSYLRSIADVEQIRADLKGAKRLAIVGAGYIGLEVAAIVRKMGVDVIVIEAQERVMSRVVCPPISAFYERMHREHGVEFLLSTGVSGFIGNDRVAGIALDSGNDIAADAVIVGIGVLPNTQLAADAGLKVTDGIVVDSRCTTSNSDVFAIGDCTLHPNSLLGRTLRLESVHNALEQARTAAANLCGIETEYAQVPWFWSDQYDLKLQIVGLSDGYDEVILRGDPDEGSFSCLYLKEERLIAVDAVNRPRDFMQAKQLLAREGTIDAARLRDVNIELKDSV